MTPGLEILEVEATGAEYGEEVRETPEEETAAEAELGPDATGASVEEVELLIAT